MSCAKCEVAQRLLSHLVGAYWAYLSLRVDEEVKENPRYVTLLGHFIGAYWVILQITFGIKNPKKEKEVEK